MSSAIGNYLKQIESLTRDNIRLREENEELREALTAIARTAKPPYTTATMRKIAEQALVGPQDMERD